MATKSCYNPLVVDLVSGQLMTTSDAIEGGSPQILDLQTLEVEPSSDLTPVEECATGACNASSCPDGREIAYLSLFTSVTNSGFGTNRIRATIVSATFINNEDADTAAYTIDWGDGGPVVTGISIGVEYNKNIGALGNGIYVGTITETDSGATFQFWYRVNIGVVSALQESRTTLVEIDLSCENYPDYTVEMRDVVSVNDGGLTIESSTLQVYNEVIDNTVHPNPTYDYSAGGTYTNDFDTAPSPETLKAQYLADQVDDITNTGILRTQCIVA